MILFKYRGESKLEPGTYIVELGDERKIGEYLGSDSWIQPGIDYDTWWFWDHELGNPGIKVIAKIDLDKLMTIEVSE